MDDNQERINQLLQRIESMERRQKSFSKEIDQLKAEVNLLRIGVDPSEEEVPEKEEAAFETPITDSSPKPRRFVPNDVGEVAEPQIRIKEPSALKTNWEKFIGENLINKIGIAIIVLGVGIGAKYAIDNQLISPLTRIILGYLAGLGLLIFAIKLKEKYDKFSAVLLSGAIAILYFITYAAYSFYDLLPQPVAFVLMVVFTAFAVLSAIKYNMQVIALIGLVGSYAVPFLLSTGEGNVVILFSYMTIINGGILVVSFKRDWKSLFYTAFGLSWLIFAVWAGAEYISTEHFVIGMLFNAIFFLLFYLILLANKVMKGTKFKLDDIILLLANSFISYAFGYYFLSEFESGSQFLGLFTLVNAVVHFGIGFWLSKRELVDKNLFYFVVGLVFVFITIAVPVQLDGNWVTLIWAGEAALLFWIGRSKQIAIYEKVSYALMVLGFLSLLEDWENNTLSVYGIYDEISVTPFFNIGFLTSLMVAASYGFINYFNRKTGENSVFKGNGSLPNAIAYAVPAVFIIVLFNTFRLEISNYWSIRYFDSRLQTPGDYYENDHDLLTYRILWILYYTLAFFSIYVH